ncbi:MAG: glycosyltransferase [Succinivibrio sp.]|nr:glycosyltransferase [Succinivibrio sp.]
MDKNYSKLNNSGEAPVLPPSCLKLREHLKQRSTAFCFLLEVLPMDASAGLELSSFRRAGLFREYFGTECWILTTRYQPDGVENALEQIRLGRLQSARLINLYDFIQRVNRGSLKRVLPTIEKNPGWTELRVQGTADILVRDNGGKNLMYVHRDDKSQAISYINFIKDDRLTRRDTYDRQGWISRTEFIDSATSRTHTAIYYRPDHSMALTETYKYTDDGVALPDTIHVHNERGDTIQRFTHRDELIAWWLLTLLRDKDTDYVLIADQVMDYQRAFIELKRQQDNYPYVRVVGVSHNCHTLDPEDVMNSRIGDNYLFLVDQRQRIDRVVTLTERQKDDIQARFGAQAHPITVIPHHFVARQLPAAGSKPDQGEGPEKVLPPASIIHVGRFAPAKNQESALQAFKLIHEQVPEATLHFFGSGDCEQAAKDKAAELGLTDSVIFHGFVADMAPVYASATCLIQTSRHEGFPLVLQEALAQGCPCLAFDCHYGPSALIENGKSGFLVPEGDTKALAEKTVAVLSDPALRERLSAAAIRSMGRFTPAAIASLWADLITELLK